MLARLALLALLFGADSSQAECDCLWQGSFVDVQGATDLVVSGTVIDARGNAIDLTVERQLRGSAHREEIRIWLKTGDYCRPEVELFPVGSQWVMALHRIDEDVPDGFNPNTPNYSYGRIGDYRLSACGGYWLALSEDRVTGNLVRAPRWDHDPEMTPVLLDLVDQYVDGEVSADALLQASQEDPELRELMLDTRAFLRGDEE